jgi:hypothetical protein
MVVYVTRELYRSLSLSLSLPPPPRRSSIDSPCSLYMTVLIFNFNKHAETKWVISHYKLRYKQENVSIMVHKIITLSIYHRDNYPEDRSSILLRNCCYRTRCHVGNDLVRKIIYSNFGWGTGWPDLNIWWFSSVPPDKSEDGTWIMTR